MGNHELILMLRDIRKWIKLMECAIKRGDKEAYRDWLAFYEFDVEWLNKVTKNERKRA